MNFRDPRVLSESVDRNSFGTPSGVPSATSSPESDQDASNTIPGGFIPLKVTSAPANPPVGTFDNYPALTYPGGSVSTNVSRGPEEKDDACSPASSSSLKNARGAGGGSIG